LKKNTRFSIAKEPKKAIAKINWKILIKIAINPA